MKRKKYIESEDFVSFVEAEMPNLFELFRKKECKYQRSWDRYGPPGLIVHLAKKFFGLEGCLWPAVPKSEEEVKEAIEDVRDSIVYSFFLWFLLKKELKKVRRKKNEKAKSNSN